MVYLTTNPDRTITRSELVDLLRGQSTTFAGFIASTEPSMVKKDRETKVPNPYLGRVRKFSKVVATAGDFDFESAVDRQRLRENPDADKYTVGQRAWGSHVADSGLVEHNGKYYMRVLHPKSESMYIVDNRPATDAEVAEIKRYLPVMKPSERHGTDKPIIYRDYSLDNILEIRIGGEVLSVA